MQRSTTSKFGTRLKLLLALVGLAFSEAVAPSEGGVIVRTKDPVARSEWLRRGAKLLADYDSFSVLETTGLSAPLAREAGEFDFDADVITLHGKSFRTRAASRQAQRGMRRNFPGRDLHLIQFVSAIKPEWRAELEALGAVVITYVPKNAYLIRADEQSLARVQGWSGTNSVVAWEGRYAPEDKLHPGANPSDEFGLPASLDTDVFAIQLIADAEANAATLQLMEKWLLAPVQREFRVLQYRNVIARLNPEGLPALAACADVVSIQPYVSPAKQDERQGQILAGQLAGDIPTGPGYLAWLASKGFTAEQFQASSFVVDLTDSGIDNGTTVPGHFALYESGSPANPSRLAYQHLEGTPHGGSTLAGWDGHGNLNAHILAGFAHMPPGFPHTDAAGYQFGLGVCPFVRIGASVVFDPDLFTNPDYANLQGRAYFNGARISANSWGMTNNTYTVDAQAYDALVRDAQPAGSAYALPGNQEMVIVFAAGNRGANGLYSVGAPGTAKNVITVGALENVRSLATAEGGKSSFGYDGCGYPDGSADNATDLATFSSRGPTSDGRMKPDLVAPGTHVVGGVPQWLGGNQLLGNAAPEFRASALCALSGGGTAGNTNNFFPLGQQFYTVSSGTSHATPAVAGACALVRQYFLNQQLSAPSPAMTKAFLMNSTRFLTGAGANDNLWSPGQGMGAVNLGRAFDGGPRILRDQLAVDVFTASGQARVFTGRVASSNEPVRVTLAWTDAPGNTIGNAFNNDLDLSVTINGQVYLGNCFNGQYSVAGGNADGRNNVESVFLPAGTTGDIVVTVTAANINSDGVPNFGGSLDQDFALVVYNATNFARPVLSLAAPSLSAEGYYPPNQAIDAGEQVTWLLPLRNTGSAIASNVVITLLATNGIQPLDSVVEYGDVAPDGAGVGRELTFQVSGTCGNQLQAWLLVCAAGLAPELVSFELPLGFRSVTTQSWSNPTPLVIPDSGKASVYPSVISVTNVSGVITEARVTLRGLTHGWPDDVDVLLVGPQGQKVLLLSDCGGGNPVAGLTLTLGDAAATQLPDSTMLVSGFYKPTNFDSTTDKFPVPAPTSPFGTNLSSLSGVSPNGNWSLFIQDDSAMDGGSLTQGWTLSLTISNVACAVPAPPALVDLAVNCQVETNLVLRGSNFWMQISVTNSGAEPATYVQVINALPPGVRVDSLQFSQGSGAGVVGEIVWEVGGLASGAGASLLIQARASLAQTLTNHCFVAAFTAEANLSNNAAVVSWLVIPPEPGGSGLEIVSNSPPVLHPIADRVVHAGTLVVITNLAVDLETPAAGLSYQLLAAPVGAQLDSASGQLIWPTTELEVGTTNQFLLQVSDAGTPVQTAVRSFQVTVIARPLIAGITLAEGNIIVSWDTLPGASYRLESATDLSTAEWLPASPDLAAVGSALTYTNVLGTNQQQFYRVLVLP